MKEKTKSIEIDTSKVKIYNGSHQPCDAMEGPCSCGAWHSKKEMVRKINLKRKEI